MALKLISHSATAGPRWATPQYDDPIEAIKRFRARTIAQVDACANGCHRLGRASPAHGDDARELERRRSRVKGSVSDLIVIAEASAKPGEGQALELALREAAGPTRAQPGCVQFSL
jgi:hypothetical protein